MKEVTLYKVPEAGLRVLRLEGSTGVVVEAAGPGTLPVHH